MRSPKIAIAVGGTGGHILPAKQLAELLQKNPSCPSLIFMGNGIKKAPLLEDSGLICYEIPSSGVRKKNLFLLGKVFLSLFAGILKSYSLLKKNKIEKVVGFGSFHAFPILFAARLLRIPIVLFEANCVLGKVNAFFAKKAALLAVQFPLKSKSPFVFTRPLPWIKPAGVFEKGSARKELGLEEGVFTFLVFGGSQGASFLNQLMKEAVKELKIGPFQVIHLAGTEIAAEELRAAYREAKIKSYVASFEKKMGRVFAASDLVICRSGAGTISELIYFGKPAFLVPYPYAADNHQEENARFFVQEAGGGRYKAQKDLTLPVFLAEMDEMVKKKGLVEWQENILLYKEREQKKEKMDLVSFLCR